MTFFLNISRAIVCVLICISSIFPFHPWCGLRDNNSRIVHHPPPSQTRKHYIKTINHNRQNEILTNLIPYKNVLLRLWTAIGYSIELASSYFLFFPIGSQPLPSSATSMQVEPPLARPSDWESLVLQGLVRSGVSGGGRASYVKSIRGEG